MKPLVVLVTASASALALAGSSLAGAPSLTLTPSTVRAGETVVVRGDAGGCTAGDTVYVLSRAFRHRHEFAGVPAVLATVRADGTFRKRTRIPHRKHARTYKVTARCGGGNLGVLAHLTVKASQATSANR